LPFPVPFDSKATKNNDLYKKFLAQLPTGPGIRVLTGITSGGAQLIVSVIDSPDNCRSLFTQAISNPEGEMSRIDWLIAKMQQKKIKSLTLFSASYKPAS
jgi:hypothetical protein